jgi:ABC-type polysaccharide/polyol phosphate transport system ATPase subunit
MSDIAVNFEHVWKSYKKDLLGLLMHSSKKNKFWALQDISFEVKRGKCLGIIGSNGAGKSTILKLIAGISNATRGKIYVKGKVGALINLGAGFHPELTGRENIFLYGAILGLSKSEVKKYFDSIVDFAELKDFIDMPVKRYSSGMYARLGFSVAVHVNPDILLVDEVLSVGDIGFQGKSYNRMLSFRDGGCAIIFVSHRLPAISTMCDYVIWLDHGQIKKYGKTEEVIKAYLESFDRKQMTESIEELRQTGIGSGEIVIERVTVHDIHGQERDEYIYGEDIAIRIHYRALQHVDKPSFLIHVVGDNMPLFMANMMFDGCQPNKITSGRGIIECVFKNVPLMPGVYSLQAQIKKDISGNVFEPRILAKFRIKDRLKNYGFSGELAIACNRSGPRVVVPYEWRLLENNGKFIKLGYACSLPR